MGHDVRQWDQLPQSDEIEGRVASLQSRLRAAELDAAWIVQPVDLYYFSRTAQFGLMVIPAQGVPGVWIRKNVERGKRESCFPVEPLPGFSTWPRLFRDRGWTFARVGLELDVLPVAEYGAMRRAFPDTLFEDVSPAIRALRQVKSPHEQACVREAGRRLTAAFSHLKAVLRSGMSERAVTSELEQVLRSLGDPGIMRLRNWRADLSPVVVASGPSAACPVAFDGPVGYVGVHPGMPIGPGPGSFGVGETLMVDVVAAAGGYFADATRVFATRAVASKWQERQAFVMELMGWIESQLVPGTRPADIYAGALARAESAGFDAVFMSQGFNQVRFVGHGVGLELDEWPVFFARGDEPLRAGMTVALEPKLVFDDGGVGLENTYIIRDGLVENVTDIEPGIIIADG